jgi:hypothetical protein
MKVKFILLLVFTFQVLLLFAQRDTLYIDEEKYEQLQDSIDAVKQDSINYAHKHSHLFTVETNYTSKVVFRGRDFGLQQYGVYNSLKYRNPMGLYLNVNNYWWSGVQSTIAKTDIGIGIEQNLSKRVALDVSYERWFLSNDTFFFGMNFNNMVQASITTEFDKLNGEAAVYFIFGTEKAFLYDFRGTYTFDLPGSNNQFYWNITPALLVEIFAGQKIKSDTTRYVANNTPYREITNKYRLQTPQLANTELQLDLNMEYNNWTLTPTYHYAYPIAINYEEIPISSYLANGYSYFTLNIIYNLYFKAHKHGK